MAKKKKKKTSLSKSRERRSARSSGLSRRMKIGKERAKGFGKSVIKQALDIPLWRPGDGSHIIDIIPYKAGKKDPDATKGNETYTYEYFVHNNVGPANQWYLCPAHTYGDACPVCEHRDKLREKGAKKAVWKPLFPKRRNLYNVVVYDRGEERKGVQVWDTPWFYSEKNLLAIGIKTDRHGNEKRIIFADAKKGKSVSFKVEPAKSKDDYASYEGWSFEKRDYKLKKSTLQSAYTLDEIVVIPKYKDIKEAYWKGGDSESKDDANEDFTRLMGELDDCEDMDELKEFIDENELEIRIKKKDDEDDVKEKIKEALEEQYSYEDEEEDEDEEDDDENYDEDDDDDEDEDDDDEDEDEEDDEDDDMDDEEEDELSPGEKKKLIKKLKKMTEKKLIRYIKSEDINVDPDDADDLEELQDMVIEELDLE